MLFYISINAGLRLQFFPSYYTRKH